MYSLNSEDVYILVGTAAKQIISVWDSCLQVIIRKHREEISKLGWEIKEDFFEEVMLLCLNHVVEVRQEGEKEKRMKKALTKETARPTVSIPEKIGGKEQRKLRKETGHFWKTHKSHDS